MECMICRETCMNGIEVNIESILMIEWMVERKKEEKMTVSSGAARLSATMTACVARTALLAAWSGGRWFRLQ